MKHLTIHAGLNAYPADSTAKAVIDSDQKAGYTAASWHFIISRDGTVTPGRHHSQSCVRSELLEARTVLSVLLLGGWDEKKGPVNDFTQKQHEALQRLYFDLAAKMLIFWTVKVHTPVPSKRDVNAWLYPRKNE